MPKFEGFKPVTVELGPGEVSKLPSIHDQLTQWEKKSTKEQPYGETFSIEILTILKQMDEKTLKLFNDYVLNLVPLGSVLLLPPGKENALKALVEEFAAEVERAAQSADPYSRPNFTKLRKIANQIADAV